MTKIVDDQTIDLNIFTSHFSSLISIFLVNWSSLTSK